MPVQPSEPLWTVFGKIYLAGSTDPLPGVVVRCAGLSTESMNDGSYEIHGVPAGLQTLTAEKVGDYSYSRLLEIASNIRHHIYFEWKTANLSGYVSNVVDGPIKGARVTIHGLVNYTDISGHYQFINVPQGTDSLRINHPIYSGFDTALVLAEPDTRFDVALRRDSLIAITSLMNTYVNESLPNSFFYIDRLYLRANGFDSLGRYQEGIRRFIYLKFDFPEILRHEGVSLVEANLQLCIDAPAAFKRS